MPNYRDNLLIGICDKLQLQPSLYELADERYHVIADTIQDDDAFNNVKLRMYPQGSFRLKTTVKPLKGNEYDLDFVVELPVNAEMMPRELYDNIYRILRHDGVHNDMVEKKTRCVRLNYANDFHIDIMPGKAIDRATNEIIVPDRELVRWYHHSNPIGYAQWFENQAKAQIINEVRKFQANAEPIEDQEITARLEPLRRAVQLIKRYRDIYCDKNDAEPVRSIVICTLMGNISSTYPSELQIISDFCAYVNRLIDNSNGEPFEVRNPVVDEDLTEKWKEKKQNYRDFVSMMKALTDDAEKLRQQTFNVNIIAQLRKMFGETLTNQVVQEQSANTIGNARKAGTLGVASSGLLNTSRVAAGVKKNTFYGD